MLIKSPFNSLRIPALDQIWRDKARYLHIVRDQHDVADSMRRHRFRFANADRWLSEEEAWTTFTGAVHDHAPPDRLDTVTFGRLQAEPETIVDEILQTLQRDHRRDLATHDRDSGTVW